MWKATALGLGIAFLALSASTTLAAETAQCDNRAKVLDLLSQNYKESPVALGVTRNGELIEVLSAEEGGTWSIILTAPTGVSCLMVDGESWRTLEKVAMGPEA